MFFIISQCKYWITNELILYCYGAGYKQTAEWLVIIYRCRNYKKFLKVIIDGMPDEINHIDFSRWLDDDKALEMAELINVVNKTRLKHGTVKPTI